MESWSDEPIDQFRIKFFLDTNILTYLIDSSYSGLSFTLDYLKKNAFADLVSSNYVIYEFVGIRKREHYLREVVRQNGIKGGSVNFSSLLKYKDDYNSPGVKYTDVQSSIVSKVNGELEKIVNDYGITYENNLLHNKLLAPTFEVVLNSRISKEDSLVLLSSLWPDESKYEQFLFLISNDKEFVDRYREADFTVIFNNHSLKHPLLEHAKSMQLKRTHHLNLTDSSDDNKLSLFLPEKIKELLIQKNKNIFLGKTIPCGNSNNFPKDVVCFRLKASTELRQGFYVTFIGKNLDFIYTTKNKIIDFWDKISINHYPYINTVDTDISFKLNVLDAQGNIVAIQKNIISRLRETGNLVFMHPDSFV